MKARRASGRSSPSSGRAVTWEAAPAQSPVSSARMRATGSFRVTISQRDRRSEEVPIAEWILLTLCALGVAGGFADPDRADLFLARVGALATVPAILTFRSYTSPSLAARRGLRTPLWIPSIAVLSALLVQASGGAGGVATSLAFLAVGAASLSVGVHRTLPWACLLVALIFGPAWFGWAAAGALGERIAFALGIFLCAIVPGYTLSAEKTAHARTRARVRELEDETGGLRHESGQALPQLRGQAYGLEERDRDLRTIARELQQDMDRACSLLSSATGAMAVTVYRPDGEEASDRLIAVAQAGDAADLILEVGARDGIFGAAFKAGTPVCLNSIREDDLRIVHRSQPERIGATLALPLVDGDRRWGVVIVDGAEGGSIDEACRDLAGNLADFVSRLITRAVDLTTLREGMRENHAFYEACREVSRHVRIESIAEAVVHSAGDFVPLDACAVVLCDPETETMRVISAMGFDPEPPDAPIPCRPSEGLIAQAIHHRTAIERKDLHLSERPPVLFGRSSTSCSGMANLLILPIVPPGSDAPPQGAMVVARRAEIEFLPEDAERLQVLLCQVGAALSNGRLFAEHESRGITDGMTSLPNHRRFQEVLSEKVASARRTGLNLSLLLVDIDKFKGINDTYGHPVGDDVIRRLARCLDDMVREGTDLAARYGGEEFCLVLDDTDGRGAEVVAERLRETFHNEVFVHKDGSKPVTFQCTVSIGVASYPDDAACQTELIERADQALYWSKQSGRNQTTAWASLQQG